MNDGTQLMTSNGFNGMWLLQDLSNHNELEGIATTQKCMTILIQSKFFITTFFDFNNILLLYTLYVLNFCFKINQSAITTTVVIFQNSGKLVAWQLFRMKNNVPFYVVLIIKK